jgi:hypothetical protein
MSPDGDGESTSSSVPPILLRTPTDTFTGVLFTLGPTGDPTSTSVRTATLHAPTDGQSVVLSYTSSGLVLLPEVKELLDEQIASEYGSNIEQGPLLGDLGDLPSDHGSPGDPIEDKVWDQAEASVHKSYENRLIEGIEAQRPEGELGKVRPRPGTDEAEKELQDLMKVAIDSDNDPTVTPREWAQRIQWRNYIAAPEFWAAAGKQSAGAR